MGIAMTRQLLPTLFLIFALVSCAAPTPTNTPAPTVAATLLTETLTPLPSPTVTATSTPEIQFARQCLPVQQKVFGLDEVASGTILLFSHQKSPDFVMNIKTRMIHWIPTFDSGGMVSPNGDLYAYVEHVEHQQNTHSIIWVINAQAEIISQTKLQGWYSPPRWLDNNRIIISTNEFGTLMVVNVLTGGDQIISNKLPTLYTFHAGGPFWRVEYSPDLEWVAYFYFEPGSDYGTIVYDVVTKQYLWQSTNGDEGQPAWSPDGQEVAVIGDGQLYLVDRSGNARTISNEIATKTQNPSWSPDGRYIAFWSGEGYSGINHLMTFDKSTGVITNYCVENPYPHNPIWSPDSRFLLVNQNMESGAILIDIQELTAQRIENIPDSTIFAWMNSIP